MEVYTYIVKNLNTIGPRNKKLEWVSAYFWDTLYFGRVPVAHPGVRFSYGIFFIYAFARSASDPK